MNHLHKELHHMGYHHSAELVTKLIEEDMSIDNLTQILEECVPPHTMLPDDITILYNQLKQVATFHEKYQPILLRDLTIILMEIIHPSTDSAVIFLEDDELNEVTELYSGAVVGNFDAQLELGHFYQSINQDEWAFDWFKLSATVGNADALYMLGNYYFMGKVVEQDLEKTYYCYKSAAEKGHADALNNFADMYLRGEYVEKDEKKALKIFKLAAEKEVPEAMYTLGYMYENGVGTIVDLEESREWFIKSAHAGDVFAANRLGHEAVENGRGEEAISWYQMAAESGDSYGEFNLGLCYENGIGTTVNLKKAKNWYKRAALKGDEQAKERLKEL
ncbi:tetratricopeptide repeat protein [Paucisalibacillus globulus]|uniref:tetratricopeptide repeat protein n=1 Tax=Paucisalibacillus globulus TaxID=351095 RepID=UPI0012EB5CD9|nr:tetratricopeptide repeat protein [Paucisalibacillus globulus]